MRPSVFVPLFLVVFLTCIGGLYIYVQSSDSSDQKNGLIWTYLFSDHEDKPSTYDELSQKIQLEQESDMNAYSRALRESDILICDGIKDGQKQQDCRDTLMALSAKNKDSLEGCTEVVSEVLQLQCRDAIFIDRAVRYQNSKLCNSVTDPTLLNHCLQNVSEKKLSLALASGSVDEQFCRTLTGSAVATCEQSIRIKQDQNVIQLVSQPGRDISACSSITDPIMFSTCQDVFYFQNAMGQGNVDLCDRIQDGSKQKNCRSQVTMQEEIRHLRSLVESQDLDGCAKLSDEKMKISCSDQILTLKLKDTRDPGLCGQFSTEEARISCKKYTTQ